MCRIWSDFWPNCGRTLKVTASIWPSSRRSSSASFLCFGTFGRILIVRVGNKKVRSLFASDRTYGFFVLRTAIVNLLLSVSLDSDAPGRADAVVTSSVRSLRLIRNRCPEYVGSATTVRPVTLKRKVLWP
jgi:hypothetical protein